MNLKILEEIYAEVDSIILQKQHPITGLLPASTAVTIHGNYNDAWVRDNVYSIVAVWGLWLAFARHTEESHKTFYLRESTIRLMRGLLRAMMRQSGKVESFKKSLALHHALHAKYDTQTGDVVVGDHDWGHLQIDATSLFLLMLAQMTASGLRIVSQRAEVDFIQNLIYYIERAYRTPDYGIWERGEKTNIGYVELNASSIGMAKAAMSALDGFDLLPGDHASTKIQVNPDNVALSSITLQEMLPRESATKEIDAALLSIIGFPAFAVEDPFLANQVLEKIRDLLAGKYGYKRFLRDGHQTVIEDPTRHYYQPEELQEFENIESEWPLFFTYEYINASFNRHLPDRKTFRNLLDVVTLEKDGKDLLPELYYIPEENLDEERLTPGTQTRLPNNNVPLTWAQSLFVVGRLLDYDFLRPEDLVPIRRSKPKGDSTKVQILLMADSEAVKAELAEHGIHAQMPDELENAKLVQPKDIARAYQRVGANKKLGLTGRPIRRLRTLTTSRLYKINGQNYVCTSLFFSQREFYLAFDMAFLLDRFQSELRYLTNHWTHERYPLVTLLITHDHLFQGAPQLYDFMSSLKSGKVENIEVNLGTLEELQPQARRINLNIDQFVPDHDATAEVRTNRSLFTNARGDKPLSQLEEIKIENETDYDVLIKQLQKTNNLFHIIEILTNLVSFHGLGHQVNFQGQDLSLAELLEHIYLQAGRIRCWSILRQASALLNKVDQQLQVSVNQILARQKLIQIGKAYTDDSLIVTPLPFSELIDKIKNYCRDDLRDQVLTQEVLVYLGILIKSHPGLFTDLITVRVSYIILLLTGEAARVEKLTQEDAFDWLMHQPPSYIQQQVRMVLEKYQTMGTILKNLEALDYRYPGRELTWVGEPAQEQGEGDIDWLEWRQSMGTINREPDDFYEEIWYILEHAMGVVIGDKLDRRNRLSSSLILSDMTPGEKAFALRIEKLLNKIIAPEYRQLTIEALHVVSQFTEQNPDLYIKDNIVIDVIIGHAVRMAFLRQFPHMAEAYHDHKPEAWTYFYQLPPSQTAHSIATALQYLLEYEEQVAPSEVG